MALLSKDEEHSSKEHPRTWEFANVTGTRHTCNKKSKSNGYRKVKDRQEGMRLFEAVDDNQEPRYEKDHVLLHTSAATPDKSVPGIVVKAKKWDQVTANVPGFTPEMLTLADLLVSTHSRLVKQLNDHPTSYGAMNVTCVTDALYRLPYEPYDRALLTRQALEDVLGTAPTTFDQYHLCWEWKETRVSFAHPLLVLDDTQKQ